MRYGRGQIISFFFQAGDGIRRVAVTGVQTCALPIYQARSENLRRDVVGKRDILLQVDRRLGEGEVIVDAVIEGDADKGEAVERGRADVFDPGRHRKPDFNRDRVVAFHLLGGQAGRLRGDLQDHRRRVRVGFDIEPGER